MSPGVHPIPLAVQDHFSSSCSLDNHR
jgi:hypothetical protein